MSAKVKYLELESLRGIAALLVVFFHMPNFHPILDFNFFKNLDLMVDLFFVLSGFVIFSAYGERLQSGKELFKFQFLRFGRLYPVHIIFLMIFLGFEIARYIINITGHSFSNAAAFEKNNLAAFIDHLLLIQTLDPGRALTFNQVAWSISIEFYTYILFGLIVLFLRPYKNYVFLFIALVSVSLLFQGVDPDLKRILRCTSGFFIGCLIAKLMKDTDFKLPGIVTFALFISLFIFVGSVQTNTQEAFIYFISAALIFGLATNQQGALNTILNNKFLVYLGTISYSMYMSHVSVLFIANYLAKVYRAPTFMSKDGNMIPSLNGFELAVYILLSLALVFLIRHLLYQYVEKPYRSRSRDLAERLKVMN